ncbi:MAG: hypothetical protein HYV07_24780 [Deltaproteobacteria bacterium]|nr:hypothetical protein [Deltaproteobacteria bacterium]
MSIVRVNKQGPHSSLRSSSIVLLWLAPLTAWSYEPIEVRGAGSIQGAVAYRKPVPEPARVEVTKDKAFCGEKGLKDERLLVSGSKGLKNVVVFISKIDRGKALVPTAATLDNNGCRYEPHVQAVSVGATFRVKNSDPVLHNTHARLKKADVFNFALPNQGVEAEKPITRTGMIEVSCDAGHTWMKAYVAAFDHPYFAVTDSDGRFTLPDVPPGAYTLAYWHEKLGQKTKKLEVRAGEAADGSLDY